MENNIHIINIKKKIEPLRQEILNHKVYAAIKSIEDLKIFMQFHVYAVWDFMSLLKSLQNNLTCVNIPWYPKGNADTRFLINEIVVGEESNVDMDGIRKSHFEIYVDAMHQCNANTHQISTFLTTLQMQNDLIKAFEKSNTPNEAIEFVNFTFDVIDSNKDYLQAAVFTFGREDLIPGMFLSMIDDLHKNFPNELSKFKYYLDRHIEVDGGHHSHLAIQMTSNLCQDNEEKWLEAEKFALVSLEKRIQLWDGIYKTIV